MDYWTKVFLVNLIVWFCVLGFDRVVLDDALENTKIIGLLIGLWSLIVLLSVPSWLIYVIITW